MIPKVKTWVVNYVSMIPFGIGDFLMQSEFSRNVIKLSTGSAFVLALSFLITPINTRLFLPEHYGIANLLASVGAMFGILLSFNLNPVILMEKRQKVAEATATLSLILLPISLILCFGILFTFEDFFLDLLNAQMIKPYIWLVYLGLLMSGISGVIGQIIQRKKMYGFISKMGIVNNLMGHAIRLPWGFLAPSFISFYIPALIANIFTFFWQFKYGSFKLVRNVKKLYCVFRKNLSFMFFQTLNAVLGVVGSQLPIFWIFAKCGAVEAGYYGMAAQLIDVPCNLLLGSFSAVYYKRVADTVANDPHMLMNLYWRNTIKLTMIGLIPLGCVAAASPFIPYILGDKWGAVTPIIQLFLIWRLMRFVTAPAYAVVTVLRKNYFFVILSILNLGMNLSVVLLADTNIISIITWLIITSIPYWSVLIIGTSYFIKKHLEYIKN